MSIRKALEKFRIKNLRRANQDPQSPIIRGEQLPKKNTIEEMSQKLHDEVQSVQNDPPEVEIDYSKPLIENVEIQEDNIIIEFNHDLVLGFFKYMRFFNEIIHQYMQKYLNNAEKQKFNRKKLRIAYFNKVKYQYIYQIKDNDSLRHFYEYIQTIKDFSLEEILKSMDSQLKNPNLPIEGDPEIRGDHVSIYFKLDEKYNQFYRLLFLDYMDHIIDIMCNKSPEERKREPIFMIFPDEKRINICLNMKVPLCRDLESCLEHVLGLFDRISSRKELPMDLLLLKYNSHQNHTAPASLQQEAKLKKTVLASQTELSPADESDLFIEKIECDKNEIVFSLNDELFCRFESNTNLLNRVIWDHFDNLFKVCNVDNNTVIRRGFNKQKRVYYATFFEEVNVEELLERFKVFAKQNINIALQRLEGKIRDPHLPISGIAMEKDIIHIYFNPSGDYNRYFYTFINDYFLQLAKRISNMSKEKRKNSPIKDIIFRHKCIDIEINCDHPIARNFDGSLGSLERILGQNFLGMLPGKD